MDRELLLVWLLLGLSNGSWMMLESSQPAGNAHAATESATFSRIHDEILSRTGCAAAFCHGKDAKAGRLDLSTGERAYESLVGVPAAGEACAGLGLRRVVAGYPDSSLLMLKLGDHTPCGMPMPAQDARLEDSDIALIQLWIELGALDN